MGGEKRLEKQSEHRHRHDILCDDRSSRLHQEETNPGGQGAAEREGREGKFPNEEKSEMIHE